MFLCATTMQQVVCARETFAVCARALRHGSRRLFPVRQQPPRRAGGDLFSCARLSFNSCRKFACSRARPPLRKVECVLAKIVLHTRAQVLCSFLTIYSNRLERARWVARNAARTSMSSICCQVGCSACRRRHSLSCRCVWLKSHVGSVSNSNSNTAFALIKTRSLCASCQRDQQASELTTSELPSRL